MRAGILISSYAICEFFDVEMFQRVYSRRRILFSKNIPILSAILFFQLPIRSTVRKLNFRFIYVFDLISSSCKFLE